MPLIGKSIVVTQNVVKELDLTRRTIRKAYLALRIHEFHYAAISSRAIDDGGQSLALATLYHYGVNHATQTITQRSFPSPTTPDHHHGITHIPKSSDLSYGTNNVLQSAKPFGATLLSTRGHGPSPRIAHEMIRECNRANGSTCSSGPPYLPNPRISPL